MTAMLVTLAQVILLPAAVITVIAVVFSGLLLLLVAASEWRRRRHARRQARRLLRGRPTDPDWIDAEFRALTDDPALGRNAHRLAALYEAGGDS